MKIKAENKLLNNSKQPDSQNDWSNRCTDGAGVVTTT